MFGWILNFVYLLLIVAVSPLLLWKRLRHGKYREGWSAKLWGNVPSRTGNGRCVWLHAVSVGEVLQLRGIIDELIAREPDIEVAISTTTQTGMQVAREKYSDAILFYAPLDFTWAVRKAIRKIRPDLFVLVELELWPNLIRETDKAGIPLVLANGRMSANSFRGYRKIRPLMANLLSCFDRLLVQNETYADRLKQLGATPESVSVTGSIKWDNASATDDEALTDSLRRSFHLTDKEIVIVAGSTQQIEEEIILKQYAALREQHDKLRLVIVPRHPERFDETADLIRTAGYDLLRRSCADRASASKSPPIILLDTLGELRACWGLADIAFVGGTFSSRGGQNMIEPAACGAAVTFGPNYWNFQQIGDALQDAEAAVCCESETDLLQTLKRLVKSPLERQRLGTNAKNFIVTQQGAVVRTVEAMSRVLHANSVCETESLPTARRA